jgi:predicted MFS family arabinose efflux permease
MPLKTENAGAPSAAYRTWVLGLLTVLYFLYLLDRTAIMVTQELIKAEFRLSDTQMGMVVGTVYGISYALAGLPMGRLVDRVNRRSLLAGILTVWSGLTALCGVSSSYWQLMLIRIGVGASEAGGSPASLSLLSDLYPPERRATVASIFYSGTSFGLVVSFFVGGLIAAEWGWRAVFLVYGIPGLLVALLLMLTVREPARTMGENGVVPEQKGIFATVVTIFKVPVLGRVYLGSVLYCLGTAAVGTWLIAFLMRVHGLGVASAGAIVAGAHGICGIVGGILIGVLADRASKRHLGGTLVVMAIAGVINVAAGLVALNTSNLTVAIVMLCFFGATANAYSGPTNGVISQLAPGHMRGMAFALFALLANLIGTGVGPIAVGMISDIVPGGQLGFAMSTILMVNLLASAVFLWGARSFAKAERT